ncbi:MAG: glycosyltransferase [Vicinamibacterales bacterium]|jgi:glycosyltransferase involved in cell wall biosynthesis|nr:glycosyltransferase [Vicinamibacterales bacterium]
MSGTGLAIVVPCFNEAAVVGASVASLCEWFPGATIVVVDDGSRDETGRHAEREAATRTNVRVLRLPANAGKGGAVAAAAPLVRDHAAVLIVDADLAFTRATMERAVAALDAVDVAIGNRRHPDSTYTVPVRLFGFLHYRHVVGFVFNAVVRACLGLPHRDTQCGLKAFRAGAFQDVTSRLRTTGFAFDLDVLLLVRGLGLRVGEVPVALRIESGRSSVRLIRDGVSALGAVAILASRRATGGYRRARLSGRA